MKELCTNVQGSTLEMTLKKKKKSDFFEKICFPRNSTDFVLPSLNSLTVSFSISIFVTLKKTNITVTSSCLLHKTFSFL